MHMDGFLHYHFVLSAGIEPTSQLPQSRILSVELRERLAPLYLKTQISQECAGRAVLPTLLLVNILKGMHVLVQHQYVPNLR